jgi:tetrahydromethanopterin S-methyltransferase subunit G
MASNVENLMLEHMKRFQATLDRVESKIGDLTIRVSNVEGSVASIIQHLGNLAAADAAQQLSIDDINRRLDRIEHRLELTN